MPLSLDTPPSLEASGVLARFVVGVPPPSSRAADEAALATEASAHGDILRVDVVEEYDNLVLKARAWVGGKEGSGAGGGRLASAGRSRQPRGPPAAPSARKLPSATPSRLCDPCTSPPAHPPTLQVLHFLRAATSAYDAKFYIKMDDDL